MLQRLHHRSPAFRRAALACLLTSFSIPTLGAEESGSTKEDAANARIIIRSTRRGWDGRGTESVKQNVQLKKPIQKTDAGERNTPQAVSASSIQLRPFQGELNFKPAPSSAVLLGAKPKKGPENPSASPADPSNPSQQSTPGPQPGGPTVDSSKVAAGATTSPKDRIARSPARPGASAPVEQLPRRGSVSQPSPAVVDPNDGWVARKAIRNIAPLTDPVEPRNRVPSADLMTPRSRPSSTPAAPLQTPSKAQSDAGGESKSHPSNNSLNLTAPSNRSSASASPKESTIESPKSLEVPRRRPAAPVERISPEPVEAKPEANPAKPTTTSPESTTSPEPRQLESEQPEPKNPEPRKPSLSSDAKAKSTTTITDLDEQDGRVQVRALKIERDGAIAGTPDSESSSEKAQSASPSSTSSRRGQVKPEVSAKKQEPAKTEPTRIASRSKEPSNSLPPAKVQQTPEKAEPKAAPAQPLDFTGRPSSPIVVNRTVARLRTPIRRALQHYYNRPEKADERSNWGMMHAVMVYGVDTKVQVGRRRLSTIAWMAGNNVCRGKRLLVDGPEGIEAADGVGLQGHQGQFLMVLSLADVPSSYPLYANGKKYSVADLVRREAKNCRSGEELTFSLIGLSHYLSTDETWTNAEGERWDFERLIAEELSQPIVGAACGGTHRLMGFAHALRHRRNEGLPITGQWARAERFLDDFAAYTYRLQNRDGSFSTSWFEEPENRDDVDRKIQTTGHMVEWLLTHTPDEELQNSRLVAAIRFLANSLLRDLDHDWSIGPKGHALRSLSLYHDRVFGGPSAWKNTSVASTRSRSTRTR